MVQGHIIISGFVQGVGFRMFIKDAAEKYGIVGWVKNTPEGTVEAVLQGERAGIEQVIKLSEKGPYMADVTDIQSAWEDITTQFSDFTITF